MEPSAAPSVPSEESQSDPRSVFIVHGRNTQARDAVSRFLQSADLEPITWEEAKQKAAEKHKDQNPYIGQILEAGFADAKAVVVLFTGDDLARLKSVYEDEDLTPQARPNVIFEAGLARGRYPSSTVFVQIGDVRGMSDIGGRHVIRFNGTSKPMNELLNALENVGCAVNRRTADLQPLGEELCEHDTGPCIEMPRRRFQLLCAGLLVGGVLAGLGASAAAPRLFPHDVEFTGQLKTTREPVTVYLAVDQKRKISTGDVTLRVAREPNYSVLYEVQKRLIHDYQLQAGKPLPELNVDELYVSGRNDCAEPQADPRILLPPSAGGSPR